MKKQPKPKSSSGLTETTGNLLGGAVDKRSWSVKKQALELCENLKNKPDRGYTKVYKFLEKLLDEDKTNQKVGISWLVKGKAFAVLEPSKLFEITIKCLGSNNAELLSNIIKAVKTQNPLKEDLGFYATESGLTLGHLAAKQDKKAILSLLGDINPEYLRAKDRDGNTIPHIASQYLSQAAIEVMVAKCPGLFWVRNNNGLRPSDLESGPLINSLIKETKIREFWEKENQIYRQSIEKLQMASKKSFAHGVKINGSSSKEKEVETLN
jgi:hypothetical protein